MSLLGWLHGGLVHSRRVTRLAKNIAPLIPRNAKVLDVGCGDGALAARISGLRPDIRIEGLDVLVRSHTAIPVRHFDGAHIPYDDASVDVAGLRRVAVVGKGRSAGTKRARQRVDDSVTTAHQRKNAGNENRNNTKAARDHRRSLYLK